MLWCCVIGVLNCILGVHVVLYCRWPRLGVYVVVLCCKWAKLYFRCACCAVL